MKKRKSKENHERSKKQIDQTVHVHLLELRSRLLLYLISLCMASGISYIYNQQITNLLVAPLHQQLYYNDPVGGFQFTLQVAIFLGFVTTVPILVYQILRFVEPVFPWRSRFLVAGLLGASVALVCLGVLTAYFLVVPATIRFLTSFGGSSIQPLITADAYFTFIAWYLGGFAILFQLPLVMLLLTWFTPITSASFLRFQRHVIVLCFVVAAILTPTPDVVNLLLFAVPLLVLFYSSIVVAWLVEMLRQKKEGNKMQFHGV